MFLSLSYYQFMKKKRRRGRLTKFDTGAFLTSTDNSVVTATYEIIASDFNRQAQGIWLLIGYKLGYCISVPLVSILSTTPRRVHCARVKNQNGNWNGRAVRCAGRCVWLQARDSRRLFDFRDGVFVLVFPHSSVVV